MTRLGIQFFTSYVHAQGTYFRYHNLARGLVELGQDVTVFGCDVALHSAARSEVRDGVQYEIVPESWKSSVFSQFNHPMTALRRSWKSYPKCDVAHLFQPFLGAALAWNKCRGRVHFYDWDDQWTDGLYAGPATSWRAIWPRFITRRLENALPRRADHTTVVSEHLAKMAIERGAKSVSILHNGFHPSPFADRATARRTLGLRPDALYVGFMGRTIYELEWCFEAVHENVAELPNLRFALCGASTEVLDRQPAAVRERVDYLGHLSPKATRDFASAIDLGLLPLEDTAFNRSRFPIKFCEHLASGNPLLCSEIGECFSYHDRFAGLIPAGTTKAKWLKAFGETARRLARGERFASDQAALAESLSWPVLSRRLLDLYEQQLGLQRRAETAGAV